MQRLARIKDRWRRWRKVRRCFYAAGARARDNSPRSAIFIRAEPNVQRPATTQWARNFSTFAALQTIPQTLPA